MSLMQPLQLVAIEYKYNNPWNNGQILSFK